MTRERQSSTGLRNLMLLLLSGVAGAVDAESYLGLGHVFTANMTGNSVLLGLAVGHGTHEDIARSAAALLGFLAGVALGAWIVEREPRRSPWPHPVTWALAVEWAMLVAVAAGWNRIASRNPAGLAVFVLILLSAIAMGIQSAAVRRLDVSGVATTYLTGTLTTLIMRVVGMARGVRTPAQHALGHPSALLAGVWLIYGAGAIVTAIVASNLWSLTAALPVVLLAAVVTAAAARFGE